MIETNLVETFNEDLVSQFSSVLCEAGKSSGWLHCTDPSGVSYLLIFSSSLISFMAMSTYTNFVFLFTGS